MTGYTPLFGSLTTGTLYGRWPDLGLWCVVLSLADRHGVVDVTLSYLAGVTGLPLEETTACMRRFCEVDRGSRTPTDEGRRLVLLDPQTREWGWRIVNYGAYRERARLSAKSAKEVETGRNRDRMQERSAETAADRRSPPETAADPLSNKTKQNSSGVLFENSRPPKRTTRGRPTDLHQQIIDAYHEVLAELPRVKVWTRRRAQALEARIRERCADGRPADQVDYWRALFGQVAASDFLCGRSTDFRADLEWLLRPENFAKVIEGRYTPRSAGGAHAR